MQRQVSVSPRFVENLARWAKGEITWAQVEGFTSKQARDFAKTACELAGRGQLKKAAAIFEGLVAFNPYDHASRAALGTVYQKMGRPDDAMREYDEAIATNGRDVVALANRGEMRLASGDMGGVEDLRRAIEVDPSLKTASAKRAKTVATAVANKTGRAGVSRSA
jgi:Flp pilus assembly protein TadD